MSEVLLAPIDVVSPDDIRSTDDILDDSLNLIEALQCHRTALPFADDEVVQYQQMRHDLQRLRRQFEQAVSERRAALALRWECEIDGQRVYTHVYNLLRHHFGDDSPYLQVIVPSNAAGTSTAEDLLTDLRRMQASLRLIPSQPPFVVECLASLRSVCERLSVAIARTHHWEEQRREAVLSERLAHSAYQLASRKTRDRMVEFLGERV